MALSRKIPWELNSQYEQVNLVRNAGGIYLLKNSGPDIIEHNQSSTPLSKDQSVFIRVVPGADMVVKLTTGSTTGATGNIQLLKAFPDPN